VNRHEIEEIELLLTKETWDDTDKLGLADHRYSEKSQCAGDVVETNTIRDNDTGSSPG
jgi:hypothetical protein